MLLHGESKQGVSGADSTPQGPRMHPRAPCPTSASHELLQVLGPCPRVWLELVHQVKVVEGDCHVLGIAPHIDHLQKAW